MDFLHTFTHVADDAAAQQPQHGRDDSTASSSSVERGGLMDKLNDMLGGGERGERNEDYLDKVVDKVQEMLGQGDQHNESASEQFKDEQISDAIRRAWKSATGADFPVKDRS